MTKSLDKPVLLIAEQCTPEQTSVPLVSWYYYQALREILPIHLVTQVRNTPALSRAGLIEGEDFTAIDSERVARPIWRIGSTLRGGKGKGWTTVMALNSLSYYYFEHLLWREFRERILAGEFSLIHRLTPLSPALPSIIAGRCKRRGIPFVIGPMNGGLPWPKEFKGVQSKEREWLSSLRGMSRLMPYWKSTYRDASVVISGSRNTWQQLDTLARDRHLYMSRNGVDVNQFKFTERPGALNSSKPLKLLFVGRLVALKCCDLIIHAASPMLREGLVEFTIVGDGPQRRELEALVKKEGLPGVEFAGNVPHSQLQAIFASSDVFTFPSIREFGGAVVLEAMACGLPVIVVDYGGPGELASSDSGILLPMQPRDELLASMRSAIERLLYDRALLITLGRAARERVEREFDWSTKAQKLITIYNYAAGLTSKPEWANVQ